MERNHAPKMTAAIRLSSGRYFDIAQPEASEFTIEDIAHALSHICRFTGHTRVHYSVAQHAVHVSELLPPHLALAGLLHDAAEAFIGDVASPLKALLPDYKIIEERVERVVLSRFGLQYPLHADVKRCDLIMLATEQRDLLGTDDHPSWRWHESHIAPRPELLVPWPAGVARNRFLEVFEALSQVEHS